MQKVQKDWFAKAVGQLHNPDNAYGLQCKDTVDHYAMAIFGRPWFETVRPADGRHVFANASPAYFVKVANDVNNANQLPPAGSIVAIAGSAQVPEGHTAVVESSDTGGMNVIQQDGYRQVPAHRARLSYVGLIGWLIPRADKMPADVAQVQQVAVPGARVVTQQVAWVRTAPRADAPLAPFYKSGLAKGSQLAVVGYVQGVDPFPGDGRQDDAWYKTRTGYYVWANAAGNSLAGLAKL